MQLTGLDGGIVVCVKRSLRVFDFVVIFENAVKLLESAVRNATLNMFTFNVATMLAYYRLCTLLWRSTCVLLRTEHNMNVAISKDHQPRVVNRMRMARVLPSYQLIVVILCL